MRAKSFLSFLSPSSGDRGWPIARGWSLGWNFYLVLSKEIINEGFLRALYPYTFVSCTYKKTPRFSYFDRKFSFKRLSFFFYQLANLLPVSQRKKKPFSFPKNSKQTRTIVWGGKEKRNPIVPSGEVLLIFSKSIRETNANRRLLIAPLRPCIHAWRTNIRK